MTAPVDGGESAPVDFSPFWLCGDDYGGVTIICRKCKRANPARATGPDMTIGYEDMPDVSTIVRICSEHVHTMEG